MRKLFFKGMWLKNKMQAAIKDERGMGVIEIAIIILVLIAIGFLFKEKIMQLVNELLDKMSVDGITP
ncbi:Flp1 family type IVb pilin [Petrocella sp. FN5]|uniref:Flp1 family type IVb pilin n=1 Tax=Petrocella sp. FN5 TaxID=3032002 RepID=UPI0023DA8612|nr:Flp1 family type IVb pilin [Petrocella sp. FN5]MDF1617097.1 Flp1 family type IVb pilin [Petrocella sp. FN5]